MLQFTLISLRVVQCHFPSCFPSFLLNFGLISVFPGLVWTVAGSAFCAGVQQAIHPLMPDEAGGRFGIPWRYCRLIPYPP